MFVTDRYEYTFAWSYCDEILLNVSEQIAIFGLPEEWTFCCCCHIILIRKINSGPFDTKLEKLILFKYKTNRQKLPIFITI